MTKTLIHPAASDMLPHKVVHEKPRASVPKSIDCPSDTLPAEIIHMICVYLRPTELANLRLVSRRFSPIGLQYMVPEVHLILAKDSFEQLKAIAAHPIASKYVTSFFFEADRFSKRSRGEWEQYIVSPEYLADHEELNMQRQEYHNHHARDRSFINFHTRHHYSEKEIARAYEKYLELLHFRLPPGTEMAKIMNQFPRLNKLKMTISDCSQIRTLRLRRLFQPALTDSYEFNDPPQTRLWPLGLPQMDSLLRGAYLAGLKVEILQCGVFDWRILGQTSKTFARMRDCVLNVKDLRLDLTTGGGVEFGKRLWGPSYPEKLEKRLGTFVTAASKLEHLQISFQPDDPEWPTYLERIVGEHHWPSLKSINLKLIATTEDKLVSFCSRHASTLKSVHLDTVAILEGDEYAALNRMRKILTLDTVVLRFLFPDLPSGSFDLQAYSGVFRINYEKTIEEWFLRTCPGAEKELNEFLESYAEELDMNASS